MEPTRNDPADRKPALTADNFMMPQKAAPESAPSPKVLVSESDATAVVDSDFVAVTGQPRSYKLSFDGPGAAAAHSLEDQPSAATDVPLNGAFQPAGAAGIDQGSLLSQASERYGPDIPEPKPARSHRRLLGVSVLFMSAVAAILLGLRIEGNKSKINSSVTTPSSSLQQQQVPLTTLSQQLGVNPATASAVTVNGQLQVTNSLVLQPSTVTGPAVTGQMYYDSVSNTLAYYNGTQFVPLQGGGNTYVTNVAGNTTTNVTNVTNITNVSGGGFTGTGTPGTLAMFNSATTLGNSLITESGTTLNVGPGTGASTTGVQGGTGGLSLNTGAVSSGSSGTITIESGASSSAASGDVTVDTGSGFVSGTVVGNLNFEDNTDDHLQGWFSASTAPTTVQTHTGTYSLAATVTTAGSWGIAYNQNFSGIPVTAGHHIFFSAWVRAATTPRSIGGELIWKNQGGVSLTPVTDSTTGWTQISASATVPAGVTTAFFNFTGGGSLGEIHYFDDITVTDLSSSSSTSSLNLGSTNAQIVNIGNMNELGTTTIDGGSGITLNAGAGPLTASAGSISISGTAASSLGTTSGSLTLSSGGGAGGGVTVGAPANSTTAFQVQNSSGNSMLNVDTTNSAVTLGVAPGQIGTTTIGVSNSGGQNGLMFSKVTSGAATTTTSVSVYFTSVGSSPNNKFQVALYADNGGTPGAKITSTGDNVVSNQAWNIVPLSVALTANTTYWLGVTEDGTANGYNDTAYTTGGNGYKFWNPGDVVNGTTVTYGAWPSTFVGGQAADFSAAHSLSAYLNTASSSNYAIVTDSNGHVAVGSSSTSSTAQLYVGSPSLYTTAAYFQGEATVAAVNTEAFNITNGSGSANVDVDTLNNRFFIDTSYQSGLAAVLNVAGNANHDTLLDLYANSVHELQISDSGQAAFKTSTNSPLAFQVQNAGGTSILTVDTSTSTITVNGTLAVNGHIVTSGTTPGIAAGAAACTTPPAPTVTGNDTSGTISITTGGSGCASGTLATITFANAYGTAPHITLTPGSLTAQNLGAYVNDSTETTTSFVLGTGSTPATSTTYVWNYQVLQ